MLSKRNKRLALALLASLIMTAGVALAEIRTYQQTKDISATEQGRVRQSADKENLFEYTFDINAERGTITRIKVRRMDQAAAVNDNTIYNITKNDDLIGSQAGQGGKVIVAVRQDGEEILQLGHRFAFTMRTSPFSQVISGVYKRVYTPEQQKHWREKNN